VQTFFKRDHHKFYVLGVHWLQTESNLCASVLISNFVEFNG